MMVCAIDNILTIRLLLRVRAMTGGRWIARDYRFNVGSKPGAARMAEGGIVEIGRGGCQW